MTNALYRGDCIDILPTIQSQSVDAVITDPPYPMIKRAYGKMTVDEWWDLMMIVCKETRRILKPTGSAMFILQPNSEHVGQMRGWLWEFMAWVCREWNMVQDVWWWNITTLPSISTHQGGLLRPSQKACVWCGVPECYRKMLNVMWEESDSNRTKRLSERFDNKLIYYPSGLHVRIKRTVNASVKNGGVTPFNVLPIANSNSQTSAGAYGHGGGTPLKLADWWTRYICPKGGTIADWFMGSGTMGIAAAQNGCDFIGIEKFPESDRDINDKNNPDYFSIAKQRIDEAYHKPQQLELV